MIISVFRCLRIIAIIIKLEIGITTIITVTNQAGRPTIQLIDTNSVDNRLDIVVGIEKIA